MLCRVPCRTKTGFDFVWFSLELRRTSATSRRELYSDRVLIAKRFLAITNIPTRNLDFACARMVQSCYITSAKDSIFSSFHQPRPHIFPHKNIIFIDLRFTIELLLLQRTLAHDIRYILFYPHPEM